MLEEEEVEVVEEETSFIAPAIRVECREHWPREWAVGGAGGITTGWSPICSGSGSCTGGAVG